MAKRILIVGQSGSGKSTLARRIGEALDVPVHDLDLVFRADGGNGPERPADVRRADLARICDSPSWVAEGVHIVETGCLMETANMIVWLDHLPWWRASGRIARRFASGAWAEMRSQRGRKRFLRFGDYWRHTRELGRATRGTRQYETGQPVVGSPSSAEVKRALAPYESKLIRVTSDDELDALVRNLTGAPARAS